MFCERCSDWVGWCCVWVWCCWVCVWWNVLLCFVDGWCIWCLWCSCWWLGWICFWWRRRRAIARRRVIDCGCRLKNFLCFFCVGCFWMCVFLWCLVFCLWIVVMMICCLWWCWVFFFKIWVTVFSFFRRLFWCRFRLSVLIFVCLLFCFVLFWMFVCVFVFVCVVNVFWGWGICWMLLLFWSGRRFRTVRISFRRRGRRVIWRVNLKLFCVWVFCLWFVWWVWWMCLFKMVCFCMDYLVFFFFDISIAV